MESLPFQVDFRPDTAKDLISNSNQKRNQNGKDESESPRKKAAAREKEKQTNELVQDKTLALVEYNCGKIYLGELIHKELTFCRTPIGQLLPDNKFKIDMKNKTCLKINEHDVQKIDKKYIIARFFGKTISNSILSSSVDRNVLESRIKTYLKQ